MLHFIRRNRPIVGEDRYDSFVPRLFELCDGDGDARLTLPQLTWFLRAAGGVHVHVVWQMFQAEEKLKHEFSKAARRKRSPQVCRREDTGLEKVATVEKTRNTFWRYYTAFPC